MNYQAFTGVITSIHDFGHHSPERDGCYQMMSLRDRTGNVVNFVISPNTYFVNQYRMSIGDVVTGYYDADAPAILIYPPQYPALVVAKAEPSKQIMIDYFDDQLLSRNGQLQLNIGPQTEIILKNNQLFRKFPGNKFLIVIYSFTTKSIPAQTTPEKIIVLCHENG